jgi:hypothetical protein
MLAFKTFVRTHSLSLYEFDWNFFQQTGRYIAFMSALSKLIGVKILKLCFAKFIPSEILKLEPCFGQVNIVTYTKWWCD